MDESDRSEETKPRKDRLIQTRVPRKLEVTLKEEARRRRLSVSHLIRNILEDTFHLVDGVVANVDQIVSDSVDLARTLSGGARPSGARESRGRRTDDLSHVYAWNEVVLHKRVSCSRCEGEIARGERGFTGLSDEHDAPRCWLCARCIESLPED